MSPLPTLIVVFEADERATITAFLDFQRATLALKCDDGPMIEEYARHLGHADLIRERLDGSVGE